MKVLAQAAGDTEDARTYELLQDMQTELFKTEQYVEMQASMESSMSE